jgi:hypothetical protein
VVAQDKVEDLAPVEVLVEVEEALAVGVVEEVVVGVDWAVALGMEGVLVLVEV